MSAIFVPFKSLFFDLLFELRSLEGF